MILKTIWTLPQNILGLLVFLVMKSRGAASMSWGGVTVTRWKSTAGLSLGRFVFVSGGAKEATLRHEYGHYLLGLRLGWLWLPLVGLPSLLWRIFYTCCGWKHGTNYYRFYTERWADRLGVVERGEKP